MKPANKFSEWKDAFDSIPLKSSVRKKPSNEESRMQIACVRWFKLAYPDESELLSTFANGGKRNIVTAKIMKAEGLLKGASDLWLSIPKFNDDLDCKVEFFGLYIEFKTHKGVQSSDQKKFERNVTQQGYKYVIVRSLDEFMETVKEYLG